MNTRHLSELSRINSWLKADAASPNKHRRTRDRTEKNARAAYLQKENFLHIVNDNPVVDAYQQMIDTFKREKDEREALNRDILKALTDSTLAMKQVAITLANIPRVFGPMDTLIKSNEALIARAKS